MTLYYKYVVSLKYICIHESLGRWWNRGTLCSPHLAFTTRYHPHQVNKLESDLKSGRENYVTKYREEAVSESLGRSGRQREAAHGETAEKHQGAHTRKTNPHKVWFLKPEGPNSVSF